MLKSLRGFQKTFYSGKLWEFGDERANLRKKLGMLGICPPDIWFHLFDAYQFSQKGYFPCFSTFNRIGNKVMNEGMMMT